MTEQIITLKTHTLSDQIITEDITNVMKLTDTMLIWETEFYCEEMNGKTEIWEKDVYTYFYSRFLKSSLVGCQVSNSKEEEGFYEVEIFILSNNRITLYFDDVNRAREVCNIISDWIG